VMAKSSEIQVSGLAVQVVRKKIKHLHLRVLPPDGRVRVSAPLRVHDDAVRRAVAGKLSWIKKHQARFAALERPPAPEYVSGETHLYQGRAHLLHVAYRDAPPSVTLGDGRLDLSVRPGSDSGKREQVLLAWYRQRLKEMIPRVIARWEGIVGVQVADWGVKRMRTRWGSCSIQARRIWLNLELIKRPPHCLEYIVLHEMVHLVERGHGKRFITCMDRYMPEWRDYREELKRASCHKTTGLPPVAVGARKVAVKNERADAQSPGSPFSLCAGAGSAAGCTCRLARIGP
jgi:predicted metal-dependent hydrolase